MKIAEVKGRPMLHWVGKRPLTEVKAFPAQLIEVYNAKDAPMVPLFENLKNSWANLLFHGDNKDILSTLLVNGFRGNIDLMYSDPPFDSGANYVRKVELRGTKTKLGGEEQSLLEQIQYTDIWANDNYLQFMYERLILIRELLSEKGSLYLHCDWHKSHYLRCLLDEVFGPGNFKNEIIWYYPDKFATGGKSLDKNHDTILHYSKTNEFIGNEIKISKPEKTKRALRKKVNGKTTDVLDEKGNKIYQEYTEKRIDDVWQIGRSIPNNQYLNYPTQKKDDVVERIIAYGAEPDSIIMDPFMGSGTTAAVAQRSGYRWIGCDINKGAIQTTVKRLQGIIKEQQKTPQFGFKKIYPSFAHYRVNDYDLQIQHNEFKQLVFEHLGIIRSKTDSFFDGLLGKELVKIIPFNHPLTMLDLQLVKDELQKRREEERNIVLVSLGKELRVDEELERYNKAKPINKIRVIELRTDKKYGSFFTHKPAQADVEISKKNGKGNVRILDFISPTVLHRLNIDANLFQAQVKNFKSQIDVVLIDTDYNGETFNIVISDVPEKKSNLIAGEYEFDLPNPKARIAVKIIDMLGEEVLTIK